MVCVIGYYDAHRPFLLLCSNDTKQIVSFHLTYPSGSKRETRRERFKFKCLLAKTIEASTAIEIMFEKKKRETLQVSVFSCLGLLSIVK